MLFFYDTLFFVPLALYWHKHLAHLLEKWTFIKPTSSEYSPNFEVNKRFQILLSKYEPKYVHMETTACSL